MNRRWYGAGHRRMVRGIASESWWEIVNIQNIFHEVINSFGNLGSSCSSPSVSTLADSSIRILPCSAVRRLVSKL
eukprot:s2124_g4.t1